MRTDVLTELRAQLGAAVVHGTDDFPDRHRGDVALASVADAKPIAVAYPRTTEEVSAILRICNDHAQPVVAQGGLTGLAGGATPHGDWVVISTERMREIEEVDTAAATMTVQAGVPLQRVQEAADEADLIFPLDLGARGSCAIGGNASTNAGGNRVLRYGMTRELILGVEAVLPDGTVISSLNKMLKNNTGYDLKHLFIGSEGTLGVITRLVLRLYPKPRSVATALCALESYEAVLALLRAAKASLGGTLSAFEVMWPDYYRVCTEGLGKRPPLPIGSAFYVLAEALGSDQAADQARFESFVSEMLDHGVIVDGVIAQSERESRALWEIRDASGELRRTIGPTIGFDVSLPIGEIDDFVQACAGRLKARWPEVKAVFFGHVGDSNIHVNVHVDESPQPREDVGKIVYEAVREWRGSISAEHGIGVLKKDYLAYSRSDAEIALMRRIKAALDPAGILNPGKIF
jgi:FAD/FMN-containing dehydrogenase